jgi:hypothetical protein
MFFPALQPSLFVCTTPFAGKRSISSGTNIRPANYKLRFMMVLLGSQARGADRLRNFAPHPCLGRALIRLPEFRPSSI